MIHHANTSWADVRPRLSILVPFLRDDPSPLLRKLANERGDPLSQVELLLLDDGTNDPVLTARLIAAIHTLPMAASLLTLSANIGRAGGRNLMTRRARGDYLLFLDADMLPDRDSFLDQWLNVVTKEAPSVVFGGFSLEQAPTDERYAVHRAMASKSDCLMAAVRSAQPEKYVFTSNLLVKSEVFARNMFDEDFTGWGWEDVEWAIRICEQHPILHRDIPATHLGLDTVAQLMEKYRQSADNFARIVARHPAFVAGYPSFRVAKFIRALSLQKPVIQLAAGIARSEFIPARLRALSLRFYRAALYAQALAPA